MSELIVIAGCNGSGKSTFSRSLVTPGIVPFDYDVHVARIYKSLIPSDIQDRMAHNMAFDELESQIRDAVANKTDFCYETNFNSTPLHWPEYFKQRGYKLYLVYLCLDSIEEAKRRVNVRVQNGGHFVADQEIEKRYFAGFANLDTHFEYFDTVDILDVSTIANPPENILSIDGKKIKKFKELPDYLMPLVPTIASM